MSLRSLIEIKTVLFLSGQNVLAIAKEAGADMRDAVNKCVASTLKTKKKINVTFAIMN